MDWLFLYLTLENYFIRVYCFPQNIYPVFSVQKGLIFICTFFHLCKCQNILICFYRSLFFQENLSSMAWISYFSEYDFNILNR